MNQVKIISVQPAGLQLVIEYEIYKENPAVPGEMLLIANQRQAFSNILTDQQVLALIRDDAEAAVAATTVPPPDLSSHLGVAQDITTLPTIAEVM
jgi:hypothetical protein